MTAAHLSPARLVIENVPKVEFYRGGPRCPEDVGWPACLRAALEHLGDSFGCRAMRLCGTEWKTSCSYAFLMGVSGAAFRLNWKPGWHGDNVATWLIDDDPSAMFRHTLDAIGYEGEIVSRHSGEDVLRARIAESLRQGVPIIAHGVVGPPEECLVTGYDEGGDVLIGWSCFQGMAPFSGGLEFEPCGYFRKHNWFADTHGAVILGRRKDRQKMRDVLRESLAWALKTVRTPVTYGDRHNGLAAYNAWAEHLLRDDEIDPDGHRRGPDPPFEVHDDAALVVAEGRWYASVFLADMVHAADRQASHLLAAASCYAKEHELMWQVWGCVGGIGRDRAKAARFGEPSVRRQIVPIIREAGARDAEAVGHLERALSALA